MTDATNNLTERDLKLIDDTIERRTKLLEMMKETRLKQIAKISKLLSEKERVAASKKSDARRKGKAAKKARKLNRKK